MTQQTLLLSLGALDLGQQLLDKKAVCIGPDAIKVSNEAGLLTANGFAERRGPDLVLLDRQGLKETLRAQIQTAQQTAD